MFDGPEDELVGLEWMYRNINSSIKSLKKDTKKANVSENKQDRLDVGVDLIDDIRARINEIRVDSSTTDGGLYEGGAGRPSLWDRFFFVQTGNESSYYEDEGKTPPYFMGEWDTDIDTPINFGWSDEFVKTETPKKGSVRDFSTHFYTKPPPVQEWEMFRVEQKGREFLIGSVEVGQIDAFCSVPQLPKEMNSSETASRILDKRKGVREWQRRVDRKRISSIKRFISSDNNLIANSVILYVPEEQDAVIFDGNKVIIDPSKFLFQKRSPNGLYSSGRGKRDFRPI